MSNSTRIKLIGFVLLLFSQSLFGQTLYWVGGSGNWTDDTHWSLNSDGSFNNPSALIPDATRSVVFNEHSFPSNADKTVTLNAIGACLNMSWTDDADDPVFAISTGLDLSIHGSLAILDGITVSPSPADAAVEFIFSATSGTPTISTEGTYLHNVRIGDETFASTAVFTLTDNLNSRWINVLSGTFDTNDQTVQAFKINADEDNTQTRAMVLGASNITITGSGAGTDLDLSGSNFTFDAGTSTIDLTNTGNIAVELGPVSRVLNNLTFSGAGAAITINNLNSDTHTFNQLTATDVSDFEFSGSSTSTFNGSVNIGVSGGNTNTFLGPVNFNDEVNLNSNGNSGTYDFDGQVTFGAGADLDLGANSTISFGGASSHTFQDITVNHSSVVSFDNAVSNSISNLIVNSVSGSGSSLSFPDGVGNATSISGTFSISSTCSTPVTVNSVNGGSQAYLTLAGSPTWDGVTVQDINENGAGTITIDRGDISNVTNITASSSCTGNILYWVGTGGGCDGTWNDGDCWSNTSGGAGGAGQPTATQDVVFDLNSFDGSNNTVTIDANNPVCKSMTWTGVTNSPTFQRTGGNYLSIYGSLTLEAGMTWNYNDQVFFLGSGDFTITSAGQGFLQYLLFYNTAGSWKLLDEFSSSSHVYLRGGTLNTNDQNFTALELDANYASDETRALILGSSYVTLTNSGNEVLDIRSTGNLLTFDAGTSTIEFTNTGSSYVELGTNDRTFYNIIGNAGTLGGNRLEFRNGDNSAVYTFNNITLLDGKSLRFVNNVVINGEVNTGTDSEIFFNGANNVFHSNVNIGSITSSSVNAHFYNSNIFNGNVTVTGPTQDTDRVRFYNSTFNGIVNFVGTDPRGRFYDDCTFNGLVDLVSDASSRFYGNDVFNAGANFGSFVTFTQSNSSGLVTTFNGASPINFADNTSVYAYREIIFGGDVTFGDNALFRANESDGNTTFEADFTTGTGADVIINNNGSGSALFQGLVNIGENATRFVFDRDAVFEQLVTIADGGTGIDFHDDTDFQAGLLIQGTANNYGAIQLYGNNTFSGGTIDFTTGTTDFGVVFENNSSNIFDATSPVILRSGARVSFRETDVFNGTFTAEDNARVRFTERNNGGSSTTFNDNVICGNDVHFESNRDITFNGNLTFGEGADFMVNDGGGGVVVEGDVLFGDNAIDIDFQGTTSVFKGTFTIGDGGTEIDFRNTTDFQAGLLIQGTADNNDAVQFYGTNTFSGGTVDFTTGTSDFGITFEDGCNDTFDATAPVIIRANSRVSFRETDVFNGTFTAEDNTRIRFTDRNNSGTSTTFNDDVVCGDDVYFESNRDITFNGDLTFGDGVDFMVNENAGSVTSEGNIVFGDNAIDIDFRGTTSTFKGSFIIGDNGNEIDFRNSTDFQGGLIILGTANNDNAVQFHGTNTFSGDTVFLSSASTDWSIDFEGSTNNFSSDAPVVVRANSHIRFVYSSDFEGTLSTEDGVRMKFAESGGTTVFDDDVTFGDDNDIEFEQQLTFNLPDPGNPPLLTGGNNTDIIFDNNAGTNTLRDFTLSGGNTVQFRNDATSNITGTVTINAADCADFFYIKNLSTYNSNAIVNFSNAQVWSGVILRGMNFTGNTVTINDGADMGNNSGTSFNNTGTVATLYWIGGTSGNSKPSYLNASGISDNWNNPANWSTTSGGSFGSCIPGPEDNVIFDHNSFSDGTNLTVHVNYDNASCHDMTWTSGAGTGVTNNPTLNVDYDLTISGSVLLSDQSMTISGDDDIFFTATTTGETITSNGVSFENDDLIFNGAGGQWILQDELTVDNEVDLYQGELNTNGEILNCLRFDAYNNGSTDLTRSLVLGDSEIEMTGSSTVLDLRSAGNNFSLTSDPNSQFTFSRSSSDYTLEVDTFDITIPNLLFESPTGTYANTIRVRSGENPDVANSGTITFRNITKTATGGRLFIDETGTSYRRATKTIENISIADNTNFYFESSRSGNYINGTVVFGNDCNFNFRASTLEFADSFTAGTGSTGDFHTEMTFKGPVTINGTSSATDAVQFHYQYIFEDDVTLGDGSVVSFRDNDDSETSIFNGDSTLFMGEFMVGDDAVIEFSEAGRGTSSTYFAGNVTFGDNLDLRSKETITFAGNFTTGSAPVANIGIDGSHELSWFKGDVTIGANANQFIVNRRAIFDGLVDIGSGASVQFNNYSDSTFFRSAVTTGASSTVSFDRYAEFESTLITGTASTTNFNLTNNGSVVFHDDVTLGADSDNSFYRDVYFEDATPNLLLSLGERSSTSFYNGASGRDGVFEDILLATGSFITFDNDDNAIENFTTTSFNTIELSTDGNTVINESFVASVDCDEWQIVRSSLPGTTAIIQFVDNGGNTAPEWRGIVAQDLTVLGPTSAGNFPLTIREGVNLDNLNGDDPSLITTDPNVIESGHGSYDEDVTIYLDAERTPMTFYWIGNGGTVPPGGGAANSNWSNANNWSNTSGGAPAGCIPNPIDAVVFDNNSFDGAGQSVVIDAANAACGDFTFSHTTNTGANSPSFEGDALNRLQIFEDFTINNNLDNNFLGNIEFITVESTKYDITNTDNDTIHFNGNVYFTSSYPSSSNPYNWLINDPIDMNDGDTTDVYDADLNLEIGYLDANGQTITIEGNWIVEDEGYYIHNNNTVIFDGWVSDKNIVSNNESFYNLYVQKGDSLDDLRCVNYPIVVENDLIISTGRLWDSDESTNGPWQIDGNGAGTLTIGNKGTLVIGDDTRNDVATEFPNTFASYSISNSSVVHFKDAGEQNVYGPFSYGNVVMSNGSDNDNRAKLLEDAITINGSLTIQDNTRFFDEGFQVSGNANTGTKFIIEGDGRFRIGVEATGTIMPEFPEYDFNIDSRVIYNAGVDQTVKGIDDGGAGNGSYGYLQFTNPAASPSMVLKTFDAATFIRRDLDINAYNNIWDGGNQISAEGSNDGQHQLEMEANTILTIGSASTATTFPTFHRNRVFVDEASTVIYGSGAASQDIRRLDNGDASNESYGNLMILNFDSLAHTNGIVSKTLVASPLPRNGGDNLKVRGDLYIGEYNNLIDDGFQINGNAAGGLIQLADSSKITIGNGTTATVFPANFDDFNLDANSEVIYNAGVAQTIKSLNDAGGLNPEMEYGHLTLTNSAGSPSLIDKTLDGLTSVRGDLTININNNLVDDGYQIEGGNILTVAGDARLTLGGTSTSSGNTTFPTSFATVNLNELSTPTSTVVYTSNREDADQEVAALGYGHLIIDSWSTSVSTNKVMQGSITVNGNLDIEAVDSDQDLTFKDNGFQIIGNVTGTFTMNPYANLEIGNGTTSTLFPTLFPRNNTNILLDDESEVIYNAGDGAAGTLPQVISGGFDYGHLTLTNPNAGGLVEKILDNPITVDGDLVVNVLNHLNDDANQITGNATGIFSMAANSQLTIGTSGVVDATEFPLLFTKTNSFIQLDDASEVIYNAGDDNTSIPQIVAGGFSYGDLTFTNPTAGGIVNKELEAVISIDGDLNINTLNNVFDKGFQITGNATGIMAMASGGQLNIGDGSDATQFPSNFVSTNIALNENSTVNYSADADQLISIAPGDGTGIDPYGQGYGNLEISNSTTSVVYKDLNATNTDEVKIQGNLIVYNWTTFRDLGTQINGPSNAGKYIEMGQQGGVYAIGGEARIILGTGAFGGDTNDATELPRGWTVLNSGTNTQEIHPTQSAIWYGAGTSQLINADFPYGKLVLAINEEDLNETGSTIRKYLQSYNSGTDVNVYGDIQIGGRNELDDNGIQIVGNATGSLTMEEDSELRLGTNTVATLFPTNYTSGNISIDVNSIVYFNSGIDQDVSGTPSSYGDVIITSAVGSPTKTLTGNMDINGNLTIENNNILDAGSGSNFNINLAGNWTNNSTFTPRLGKVEFDGNANQDITSGTSKFHDVELNNSNGVTLQDDLTIEGSTNGEFTFTDGYVNMITVATDAVTEEEVIFEDGATHSGAGINSHVVGPVRKIGTSDFTMPVGDGSGTYYNPVGVSDITGGDATTAFVGQYFPISPEGSYTWLNKDTTIHHVSRKEYWMLDREVTTASAKVTLYYQNPKSEVVNPASLLVSRWDSGDAIWQDKGASNISGNAVTSDQISEFSPFTFADYHPINPLPVTLVEFNARYIKDEGVDLTWKTANETGNAGFILKRSIGNSNNFEVIAHYDENPELVGKGNSGRINNYYYLDEIGISPGEVHYYQLVQVDKDGNTTNSEIKAVNVGSEVVLYQNHPNPARNKTTLSFSIDTEQRTVLEVFDMNGRKVATVVDEILEGGTYQYPMNISNLQTGIYTARLIHGKKVMSIKMSIIN
ncbi:T9SS type A sorting domain-containing protein [Flexithrix dorotheae]|uniref:T9SS type A sorting domain-containing protein n=1 Tax=Flexithrix dorotheae TaxID=70993 RepID=UPI00035F0A73|nr:T9SS type A sorting domain-containing protein [Flexithrix dorotheae]